LIYSIITNFKIIINIDTINNISIIIYIDNHDIERRDKLHKEVKADMEKKNYINAQELSSMLGISVSRAYRVIRKLNEELEEKGYLVIAGRVLTKYFEQRWFSGN